MIFAPNSPQIRVCQKFFVNLLWLLHSLSLLLSISHFLISIWTNIPFFRLISLNRFQVLVEVLLYNCYMNIQINNHKRLVFPFFDFMTSLISIWIKLILFSKCSFTICLTNEVSIDFLLIKVIFSLIIQYEYLISLLKIWEILQNY